MRKSIVFRAISHLTLAVLMLAALALTAAAQSRRVPPTPAPTPPDDETERVFTEEIKLNVLAFDQNGQFFKDVTENDLVITEGDILHQPQSVRRLPANVLVVMDTGGVMRSAKSIDQTRKVAASLIEALRPGDSIALMQYSDKPEVVAPLTSDKAKAMQSLKLVKFGRESAYVDALNAARKFLQNAPIENKHIVLITDGTDSDGQPSAKFDAMQHLMATDISVHVISYTALEAMEVEPQTKRISNTPPPKAMPDEIAATLPNGARDTVMAPKAKTINMDKSMLRRVRTRKADLETSEKQLEKLAEGTNGEFILPVNRDEMVEKAALVARMIDSTYVVTYAPKMPVVGTRGVAERTIAVTSKRPGLTVQARRKLVMEDQKKR